jgi:hypothetical protein
MLVISVLMGYSVGFTAMTLPAAATVLRLLSTEWLLNHLALTSQPAVS